MRIVLFDHDVPSTNYYRCDEKKNKKETQKNYLLNLKNHISKTRSLLFKKHISKMSSFFFQMAVKLIKLFVIIYLFKKSS